MHTQLRFLNKFSKHKALVLLIWKCFTVESGWIFNFQVISGKNKIHKRPQTIMLLKVYVGSARDLISLSPSPNFAKKIRSEEPKFF